MTSSDPSTSWLWRGIYSEEPRAEQQAYEQYAARLLALTQARMSPALRQRVDAEDVLQSAFRTMFLGIREGRFQAHHSGSFWHLLARLTLNKLRRQIEVHTAQRRDIGAEQAASDSATPEDALSREPSAEDICVAAELLARCLEELSPAKRQALLLRLEDRSTAEIAGEIGRTERTVRRWLHEIGERWLLLARSSDS